LARIDRENQKRIIEAIYQLAECPRPSGCKKLIGRDAWRVRVGTYRIIFEIRDDRLLILVIAIGDRKDIYRQSFGS